MLVPASRIRVRLPPDRLVDGIALPWWQRHVGAMAPRAAPNECAACVTSIHLPEATTMDIALLILRLVIGSAMTAHGAQKLFGWFGGTGLTGTGAWFETLGFRPGVVFALLAGATEVSGGVCFALGLFGPLPSALILAVMVVAIVTVHVGHGFFAANNGVELPVL